MKKRLLIVFILISQVYFSQTWQQVGITGDFANGQTVQGRTLAFYNNEPYVIYYDTTTFNTGFCIKRYTAGNWVQLGLIQSTMQQPLATYHAEITFDQAGILYVAIYDGQYEFIMQYLDPINGWFIPNGTLNLADLEWYSVAADTAGGPYIAYQSNFGGKANVIHLPKDSMNWINVGPPDFSNNFATYIHLVLDKNGTPYVGYDDYNNVTTTYTTTVKKFNGSNWINVGAPPFSGGSFGFFDLEIDSLDKLYMVHQTDLLKYNGSSWTSISSNMPGPCTCLYDAYHVSKGGNVYYTRNRMSPTPQELEVFEKVTNAWPMVGAGININSANYMNIATNNQGIPYVFYSGGAQPAVVKLGSAFGVEQYSSSTIDVYPNPGNGKLFLKSDEEINHLEVRNLLGDVVYSDNEKFLSKALDFHLPPGTYYLSLIDAEGEVIRKTIIRQ